MPPGSWSSSLASDDSFPMTSEERSGRFSFADTESSTSYVLSALTSSRSCMERGYLLTDLTRSRRSRTPGAYFVGPMASMPPIHGASTSGTRIVPSGCW
jgi:hypothetical protein